MNFLGSLLFNLRYKSLISSDRDSQRLTEIVPVVQLQTLHKISRGKNNFVALSAGLHAINTNL